MQTAESLNAAQRLLVNRMSQLSEETYAASWLIDLELCLWRAVVDGPAGTILGPNGHNEVEELKWMSDAAGGWFTWGEDGPEFLPMEEWQKLYKSRT
jgi:hypothetical protein